MFRRFFLRYRTAKRLAAEAQRETARVEAQWPEVRELASWAKTTREQNHLTALFMSNLNHGGKS